MLMFLFYTLFASSMVGQRRGSTRDRAQSQAMGALRASGDRTPSEQDGAAGPNGGQATLQGQVLVAGDNRLRSDEEEASLLGHIQRVGELCEVVSGGSGQSGQSNESGERGTGDVVGVDEVGGARAVATGGAAAPVG